MSPANDPLTKTCTVTLSQITHDENLLILAPRPGDEALHCGGLIAQSCRRGRPPFVMILTDGSTHPPQSSASPVELARLHDQETRAAVQALGLPANRLLMAGLIDTNLATLPPAIFEALVQGIALVMWARDCNIIVAPPPTHPAHHIARIVATRTKVGLLTYGGGYLLNIEAELSEKQQAIAAHHVSQAESQESYREEVPL